MIAFYIFIAGAFAYSQVNAKSLCAGANSSQLIANLSYRIIYLCEKNGNEYWRYFFSYGRGGARKYSEGDEKTPVGTYALGAPQKSADFYQFIPIGYPTKEQRKMGYTGGAIGIHGPYNTGIYQLIEWFMGSSLILNWTSGCLAVSSQYEIEKIVYFVKSRKVKTIHIFE
ncbi:MAG: hypothetical protein A2Z20_03695 [Bdellovibrionales bacterium RBG_16_40_8]|nr:MAG: hypothetical protein A2Z20_03695 [Bdellovibrionales bacterium RBG_16_40_8]